MTQGVPPCSDESSEHSADREDTIRGSGAFEKRADVFPVDSAKPVPLQQLLDGDGPLMNGPVEEAPRADSRPTDPPPNEAQG